MSRLFKAVSGHFKKDRHKAEKLEKGELTRLTYRYDIIRMFFGGVDEIIISLGILIAIRGFPSEHLSQETLIVLKPLIVSSIFFGMLLVPLSTAFSARTGWRASSVAAFFVGSGGVLICLTSLANSIVSFIVCLAFSKMVLMQEIPNVSKIYASNYHPRERGRRVGTALIASGLGTALVAYLAGKVLDINFQYFHAVFMGMGLMLIVNSLVLYQIPSGPLGDSKRIGILDSFACLKGDLSFAIALFSSIFMGLGGIMIWFMRVEYLADTSSGFQLSNFEISAIVIVVPQLFRVLTLPLTSFLFDRLHYVLWRWIFVIAGLGSVALLFYSQSLPLIYLSSALFGFTLGGFQINQAIWFVKLAPQDKVPHYSALNAFLTGIRGSIAPFLGYYISTYYGFTSMANFSILMIFLSGLIILFLMKEKRFESSL